MAAGDYPLRKRRASRKPSRLHRYINDHNLKSMPEGVGLDAGRRASRWGLFEAMLIELFVKHEFQTAETNPRPCFQSALIQDWALGAIFGIDKCSRAKAGGLWRNV